MAIMVGMEIFVVMSKHLHSQKSEQLLYFRKECYLMITIPHPQMS